MDTASPLRVVFEPRAEPHAPDLYAFDAVVEGVEGFEGFEAVGKAEIACYFDALLPHGTPRNDTSQTRWALQYHYVPVGAERVTDDKRLAIFGSEGKDVTC